MLINKFGFRKRCLFKELFEKIWTFFVGGVFVCKNQIGGGVCVPGGL